MPSTASTLTYYEILGVAETATADEIRAAFRREILKWHPDRNQERIEEATRRTRLILEAYEVLKDPEARRSYDEELHSTDAYEDPTEVFRTQTRYGQEASTRASQMEDWDLDQILSEAATTVWKGSQAYRSSEAGAGSTMAVGFCGWLLVLCMFFPPVGIVMYFVIRGTFFPNGRFVGIGTVLTGMFIWLLIAIGIAAVLIVALNSH